MGTRAVGNRHTQQSHSNILKNVGMSATGDSRSKSVRELERCCKGVANHWRIAILFLIAKEDGITLDQIARSLAGNFKTISEHTRRLTHAGLVEKTYVGKSVAHKLTPTGRRLYTLLSSFQHS